MKARTLAVFATGAAGGFDGIGFPKVAASFLGLMALTAIVGARVPWLFPKTETDEGVFRGVVTLAAGWYFARAIAKRLDGGGSETAPAAPGGDE